MLGTSLQFGRGHGDDRFHNRARTRPHHHHHHHYHHQNSQRPVNVITGNNGDSFVTSPVSKGEFRVVELENRAAAETAGSNKASHLDAIAPSSNLNRFLESTTLSIPAQYLPKTTTREWMTCDVENQPYFSLGDLWESFKEWSAYGAGVPLVLNDSDRVVQYYVPYLSGIQLYGEPTRQPSSYRRPGEESDVDGYRDSSSDGSSDCELERGFKPLRDNNHHLLASASMHRSDRLSLREMHAALQEGSSSDDGESENYQGHMLFEFLEQSPPYSREPLVDKISDLARRFPELKTLRSCDLSPSSWISVAWYPIYRIPTGTMLKDLDACFLSFHSLSTSMREPNVSYCGTLGPVATFPEGVDGIPKISIPVFGLASYKFKGSMWIPTGGSERQLTNSLLQAADNWLRLLHVDHPDFQFFTCRR